MKFPALFAFVALVASAPLSGQEKSAAAPAPASGPKFEMVKYYFCLLTRGAKTDATQEEVAAAMRGHMANMEKLSAAGKLLVAGPFADKGDWRGIFILKCDTLEEANALVATDPAVVAGLLKAEIHPWMTAKGYIRDPAFPMAP
jgi:uncharacterized protein YciI